jgi:signal recognition particle subunit SRP54
MKDLMDKMPLGSLFGGQIPQEALDQAMDDRELTKIEAMIQSMTKRERERPDMFLADEDEAAKGPGAARWTRKPRANKPKDPSKYAEMGPEQFEGGRVARVARGSGRSEDDVRGLVGRFLAMRDVFGMLGGLMGGGGMLGNLPGVKQLRQLGAMRKLSQNPEMLQGLMGGGGMPGLPGGMPGMPGLPAARPGGMPRVSSERAKADRKKQKDARKKNRKK